MWRKPPEAKTNSFRLGSVESDYSEIRDLVQCNIIMEAMRLLHGRPELDEKRVYPADLIVFFAHSDQECRR